MKIKDKILRWGLISLAAVSALSALTAIYSVGHPNTALAADVGAPIGLQADSSKSCAATAHAPGSVISAYQSIDNSASNGQGFDGQQYHGALLQRDGFQNQGIKLSAGATKTFALGSAVYITFKGTNSKYDSACSEAMFLIQSPDDPTKFYGLWFNPVNGSYQEQDATVDAKAATLQFNLVYSTFNKSFTINLASDPADLLSSSLFNPIGGGSASAADGSCVVTVSTPADLKKCIDNASTSFKFTNVGTITFGKDVYKATNWGYSGSDSYKTTHIEYMLDHSGYVGRSTSGKIPEIDLDTKTYDINIDDLNGANIDQFFTSLSSAAVAGHVNMTFKNFSQSGEESDYNGVSVESSDINIFAGYYPNGTVVATYFVDGGDNEKHFITSYAHTTDLNYVLTDGENLAGCTAASSKPSFTLNTDPTKLAVNTITSATWHLPDSSCTMHTGNVRVQIIAANVTPPSAANTGQVQHDSNATCDTGGDPLNWILCPVFNSAAGFADWLFANIVVPFLRTSPVSTDPADSTFKIWSNFRIYGNIFLVIALLVVVFGQAIGGGVVDAYTAKKVLPRLLIAAILINLSIYIVAFLVDLTNIVGGSLGKILTQPLANAGAFNITPSGIGAGKIVGVSASVGMGAILLGFASKALIVKAIMPIMLFIIMPVVFGLITAFVTLIIRKGLILALLLISPVAFALYCLPNTEKYFRKWWDLLLQTLLVYPIIIIFFAVADILSVTIVNANGNSSGIALLVAFILQWLPLLGIAYAISLAGGLVGKVHEVITSGHKRAQEGIKGNVNDPNSLRNRAKRQLGEAATRAQNQVVQRGRKLDAPIHQRLRSALAGHVGNVDSRMSNYNAEAAKRLEQLQATGDDALIYAGAGYESGGKYYDSKGREISKNTYKSGKRLYGDSQHSIAQGLGYSIRKSQTDTDIMNNRRAMSGNAAAENWDDYEVNGVWSAAAYPNKPTHASEWYSKPKVVRDSSGRTTGVRFEDVTQHQGNYGAMIQDLHQTREAFKVSSDRDADMRVMYAQQQKLERGFETGRIQDMDKNGNIYERDFDYDQDARALAQTYETFDGIAHNMARGEELDDKGEHISASGTPASQAIVKAATLNRNKNITMSGTNGDAQRTLTHTPSGRTATVQTSSGVTSRDAFIS